MSKTGRKKTSSKGVMKRSRASKRLIHNHIHILMYCHFSDENSNDLPDLEKTEKHPNKEIASCTPVSIFCCQYKVLN